MNRYIIALLLTAALAATSSQATTIPLTGGLETISSGCNGGWRGTGGGLLRLVTGA